MPPVALLGAAVVGGVASYAASSKATKAAKEASNYAADQNAQVNREIYKQTRSDLAPYNQAGQAGLSALMSRLGVSSGSSGAPSGGAAAPAAGSPNYQAYFDANPDLGRDPSLMGFNPGDLTGDGKVDNADRGAWHYQNYGQTEGRALPGATQQQAAAAPAQPAQTPQQEAQQFGTRPTDLAVPTYQRGEAMNAPDIGSYLSGEWWTEDPSLDFVRSEALNGVNANFAARGAVRSGGAAKALQDRAANVANTYINDAFNRRLATYNAANNAYQYGQDRQDRNFLDDRSYGTNLWNTQQGRADNIFSDDRGFAANRYDQNTSNLFGLAGIGQNAAAGTANAGNVFAQNQIANNNQRASTTANAAIANAQNMGNLFGSAAGALGTYAGLKGRI